METQTLQRAGVVAGAGTLGTSVCIRFDWLTGCSARSSEDGSSPSAVEMSLIPSRIAPGSGCAGPPGIVGTQPPATGNGRSCWCSQAFRYDVGSTAPS